MATTFKFTLTPVIQVSIYSTDQVIQQINDSIEYTQLYDFTYKNIFLPDIIILTEQILHIL